MMFSKENVSRELQPEETAPERFQEYAQAIEYVAEDVEAIMSDWRKTTEVARLMKRLRYAQRENDRDAKREVYDALEPHWRDLFDQMVTAKDQYCGNFEGEEKEWNAVIYDIALIAQRTAERRAIEHAQGIEKDEESREKLRALALQDTAWEHAAVRLIVTHAGNPELPSHMARIWESIYARLQGRFGAKNAEREMRVTRNGTLGMAGAALLLHKSGVRVYESTSEEDVDDKIDFFGRWEGAGAVPVALLFQIKTSVKIANPSVSFAEDKLSDLEEKEARACRRLISESKKYERATRELAVACWMEMPAVAQETEEKSYEPHLELEPHTGVPSERFLDIHAPLVQQFMHAIDQRMRARRVSV